MRAKSAVVNGDYPLADEHERRRRALALLPAQRPELIALDRVCARGAVPAPADVRHRFVEVDLVPTEVAHLGRPRAVPVGQQDHGRAAVTDKNSILAKSREGVSAS
jgi:hypothetical protein